MVSCKDQSFVYNIKLSSVGPGQVTGSDVVHEPNGMELAMKLHYVNGVYFFSSQASQGITIRRIKDSMFYWLNDYYVTCGRLRRSECGRPYIKCNDCGVRFVEAQCDKTVDEWLEMRDSSLDKSLVYHRPIGPELTFSPSLYLQVTQFKCGGMSLGLSWAHILGDAISAAAWMNAWGNFLANLKSNRRLNVIELPTKPEMSDSLLAEEPLSLKQVYPVGDHWVTPNKCKMETFSFHLTTLQISHLYFNIWGQSQIDQRLLFESLCAIMWQCIAKVREGLEPKTVTLCKKDPSFPKTGSLSNSQIISSVEAKFSIVDSNFKTLATLLADQAINEKGMIEAVVNKDNGVSDYIIYGAQLTFVDLEEADLYGLEWNGHKPEFVHYTIQGVGDGGAVLVLPWPKDCDNHGNEGKVVTVILPENEVTKLKSELKKNMMFNQCRVDNGNELVA